MRRREFCLGLIAMPALARSAMAQEVSSITLIKQHGLPYLPMMLMEEFRLVESMRLGSALPISRPITARSAARNRSSMRSSAGRCISASRACRALRPCGTKPRARRTKCARFAPRKRCRSSSRPTGPRSSRSGTSRKVTRSRCRASRTPIRRSACRWQPRRNGDKRNYAQLDPFTITLPHPDAVIAIISRSTELAGHYGVAPFQNYALAAPGVHAVLKSYDTLGGPTTNGVVFMAKKFRRKSEGDERGLCGRSRRSPNSSIRNLGRVAKSTSA